MKKLTQAQKIDAIYDLLITKQTPEPASKYLRLGNFEVYDRDIGVMTYNDAVKAVEAEIWKPVTYHEERYSYEISSHGNIRNVKTGRLLKQSDSGHGYLVVSLSKKDEKKTVRVHRLVALHFLNGTPQDVNHIDGNKKHNHFSNLEWTTSQENTKHAEAMGLKTSHGQYSPNSRFYDNEIQGVIEQGKTMTAVQIAKQRGTDPRTIRNILRGKTYKNAPRALRDAGCLYCSEEK